MQHEPALPTVHLYLAVLITAEMGDTGKERQTSGGCSQGKCCKAVTETTTGQARVAEMSQCLLDAVFMILTSTYDGLLHHALIILTKTV